MNERVLIERAELEKMMERTRIAMMGYCRLARKIKKLEEGTNYRSENKENCKIVYMKSRNK